MTRSSPRTTSHWRIRFLGKTMFLNFLLARLISARQVVLLHNISKVYLFYRGQVYSRLEVSGLKNLPKRLETGYYPLWLLIDVDTRGQEPIIPGGPELWPIQACSPNHLQWKPWKKQFGAAEWGMPLWDMEELMEGYVSGLFPLPTIDPSHVVW
jgi:hypothetical protein